MNLDIFHIRTNQKEKQAKEKGSANRKKKVAKEKEISQNIYTSHDHQKENKQRKRSNISVRPGN